LLAKVDLTFSRPWWCQPVFAKTTNGVFRDSSVRPEWW